MALINCPECSKEISDKANACPNCGCPIEKTESCSTDNSINSPEEGLHNGHETSQEEIINTPSIFPEAETLTTSGEKAKMSKKKLLLFISIGLVVIAGIVAAVILSSSSSSRSKYIDNLNLVSTTMLMGAAQSETVCNLTHDVWYNTIFKESDSTTDDYTKTSYGTYNEDFNVSLSNLYSDGKILSQVSDIEANQALAAETMKLLTNPPEEFGECFEIVNEMYSAYYNLTDLAISPSGSLTTFSEDFSAYDNAFIELYDKLQLYIPEK